MNIQQVEIHNSGKKIEIQTGKLAKQAHGSVVVRQGNTMLLATVVSDKKAGENIDFLPLTVDYREKFASSGKIPGGFFKREARPTDNEILISRLIDRALRPLFPSDYHANTMVTVNLISADNEISPDTLACLAASSAIMVSDIPFQGPVSEVRVGRVDGQFVINPDRDILEKSDIDMIIAATETEIMMVEGEMKEISEEEMADAIMFAHQSIKEHCKAQKNLESLVGSNVKRTYSHEDSDEALYQLIKEETYTSIQEIARKALGKDERSKAFENILEACKEKMTEEMRTKEFLIKVYFSKVKKEAVRRVILDDAIRLDGRKYDEVRPIWSEVPFLPSTHGSALFTRGETQSLTTVTLGSKLDEQSIDGAVFEGTKGFILHYNFPSFSTGEAHPNRGVGRREVGHGNLAERALGKALDHSFPYTIRVVSDILESNGSSSMATVCAGSMALMDAGVPISGGVSGIAMGLITDNQGKYAILSDILGDEDHLGDMDFKVAGTAKGITACQMDIKIDGLTHELLLKALHQAKAGRSHILAEMEKVIKVSNPDVKPYAPRIESIKVDKEFIGAIIGPGGKIIQALQAETNTVIFIEEQGEYGIIQVSGVGKDNVTQALNRIKGIATKPEVNTVYTGTVKTIVEFGAFVEFLPGKEGLLHVSEIAQERVEDVNKYLKIGQEVQVKLLAIDQKTGKYKLSKKQL
ncbi:MAG: polyribonucleotide nucleotidyltransferase [Chitinophagales bacterium]|jgi:polyribonucleotide nucleotidyltransferase|nr:polyribonucleotide nucleotidyltransferase [Chitinophagales bacterium]